MTEMQDTPPQGTTNTMAIISMIAGILSILSLLAGLCLPCLGLFSLIFGPLAVILGFIGRKKIGESEGTQAGKGLAIGGIITGLIGTVGAVVALILFILGAGLIAGSGVMYPQILNFIDNLNY